MADSLSAFSDAAIEAEYMRRRAIEQKQAAMDAFAIAWREKFPKRPFGDGSGQHVAAIELTQQPGSITVGSAARIEIWEAIDALVRAQEASA